MQNENKINLDKTKKFYKLNTQLKKIQHSQEDDEIMYTIQHMVHKASTEFFKVAEHENKQENINMIKKEKC